VNACKTCHKMFHYLFSNRQLPIHDGKANPSQNTSKRTYIPQATGDSNREIPEALRGRIKSADR